MTSELTRSSKRQVHCVNKKYSSKCIGKFTTYVARCSTSSSTPRWKKTTKSFCKDWASKLAESDAGFYYNQEKWLKDDKASEKPIETTRNWLLSFFTLKKQTSACYSDCLTIDWRNVAKVKWSSYCSSRLATSWPHEFLVSGVSFLGCKVAKWAMKSWEVPLHIKIGRRTCSGREASRKLKEAVCCRFCQGSVKLLENVSSKSGLGSTWLVRWKIRTACCKYLIII